MQSAIDSLQERLRLLSSQELEEIAEIISQILAAIVKASAIGVLIWDPDLEEFSDRFLSGSRKKDFKECIDAYEEPASSKPAIVLDADEIGCEIADDLQEIIKYRIEDKDGLVAVFLMSGVEDIDLDQLHETLSEFPFAIAIRHGWELRELTRENKRLRMRYEELEDRIIKMEEQTRQLIHDVMAKEALKSKHTERERLVYRISNAVRSSLEIEKVLQEAVDNIGATLQVSRCLILGADLVPAGKGVDVYEYHMKDMAPAHDLFFAEEGPVFIATASKKYVPQYLGDSMRAEAGHGEEDIFNGEFLARLNYRSGLIVPLILRDNVLGIIFLQDCLFPRDWDIEDIALLGSLADQLSVAISNAQLDAERKRLSVTDELTGIANRRRFIDEYKREFEKSKRYNLPLSLVIVDLDFLKKINDTYGHQVGDQAIKSIGQVLNDSSRTIDLAARYGGEEFCLLLPNTDLEMAVQIAERVRKGIEEVPLEGPGNVTASLGVACYPQHGDDAEALFQKADDALYEAKGSGRNRVSVAK